MHPDHRFSEITASERNDGLKGVHKKNQTVVFECFGMFSNFQPRLDQKTLRKAACLQDCEVKLITLPCMPLFGTLLYRSKLPMLGSNDYLHCAKRLAYLDMLVIRGITRDQSQKIHENTCAPARSKHPFCNIL